MAEVAKLFGRRMRALRQARRFSQVDLAERAGMSEEWVRRMERGEGAPSFRTMEALCAALGARIGEFFSEDDPPSAPTEQLAAAIEGLTQDQIAWLIDGARLMRR